MTDHEYQTSLKLLAEATRRSKEEVNRYERDLKAKGVLPLGFHGDECGIFGSFVTPRATESTFANFLAGNGPKSIRVG